MLRKTPLMTWGIVLTLSLQAFGQFDALDELYGNGVHAYNGGNYAEAYNELTRAIDNGSADPRVYYYRGLSYLKLGRPQEAQSDFAEGAKLEMADSDRFYNVSKSMERVQGRPRALLERYRAAARLAAFHEREQARFERYERIRQNEPNVQLKPSPAEAQPGEEPSDEPAAEKKPAAEMTDDEPPPPADLEEKKPAAPADDAEAAAPAKKIPAGKLAKGLLGSLTRGAMKTAAGQSPGGQSAGDQPASAEKAPAEKPADGDPFAN
ncbi:MAG TPA: tetratricopeptide repeat protein [Pirellulales bacterium]|nr:tetratricopeptide repeat protein [Pirellulales bacterium]